MKHNRNSHTTDIGLLDEKIILQKQVLISDGNRGKKPTWENWKEKWTSVQDRSGKKYSEMAGKNILMKDVNFYINHDSEIDILPNPSFRIIYPAYPKNGSASMAFRVDGIKPVKNKTYFLEIMATGTDVVLQD